VDSLVTPGCVFLGHFFDQCGGGVVDGRAPGSVRIGPLCGDQATVPAQDGAWCDQAVSAECVGSSRMSVDRIVRSAQFSRGFRVVLRSTATSWRKTSNSTSLAADE
jgi:hypothetical protein